MVVQAANDKIFEVLSADGASLVVIGTCLLVLFLYCVQPPLTTPRSTQVRHRLLHPELFRYATITSALEP